MTTQNGATAATSRTADPIAAHRRILGRVVGRERELELVLAAVDAGRDLLLEGPPGTSKTTILKAVTAEWGIPLVFVEGNADLTPGKLVGHHDPSRVLREDYSAENFVAGPLVEAMRSGGFLYVEELNRAPEDTLNSLLTAMADRTVQVPRVGTVTALPTFRVVASMNPYDNVGTTRLSTSILDRFNRVVVGYQDAAAEERIVALRAGLAGGDGSAGAPPGDDGVRPADGALRGDGALPPDGTLARRLVADAVAVTRATREHEDVRQGSSVRGAIDLALVAERLTTMRGIVEPEDERYPETFYDAMTVALSGRILVDEAVGTTPERVLRQIWEDRFVLGPATAGPG